MAGLKIITEGDPRLREKAVRVRTVDDDVRQLVEDMFETMRAADGVGLAAPQVGILRRIIVIGMPENLENEGDPAIDAALVNPEIIRSSGRQVGLEACLSIPNWYAEVPRAMHVTVKARNLDDKEIRIKATGYFARVLQHEIDHLDGILFLDRVEDRSTIRHASEDDGEDAPDAGIAPEDAVKAG